METTLSTETVQRWLDTLSWEFNPHEYRACTCGRSFRSVHFTFKCCDCSATCPHDGAGLTGHIIQINGVRTPKKLCFQCGRLVPLRKGAVVDGYLFRDNRDERPVRPCARCGSTTGTELHHWAPRAIFGVGESERWPVSHLCPGCHRTWHEQMRKAGGHQLPAAERIDDLSCLSSILSPESA